MAADFWILSNFIFCAGINQAALLPVGDDTAQFVVPTRKRKFQKR